MLIKVNISTPILPQSAPAFSLPIVHNNGAHAPLRSSKLAKNDAVGATGEVSKLYLFFRQTDDRHITTLLHKAGLFTGLQHAVCLQADTGYIGLYFERERCKLYDRLFSYKWMCNRC